MKIDRTLPLPGRQDPTERARAQDEQLKEASKMYEQHFIREMVKSMRQAVPEGDLVKKSFGEKIWTEQLDNQYVENWSNRGGVGLADMIYQNIKERYFPESQRDQLQKPAGPLPLEKSNEWKAKGTGAEFRFQSSGDNVSPEARIVKSPWAGKVVESFQTENGLNHLRIQHDQGLVSKFVFPGSVGGTKIGTKVEAGGQLGQVQGPAPWLHWALEGENRLDQTS